MIDISFEKIILIITIVIVILLLIWQYHVFTNQMSMIKMIPNNIQPNNNNLPPPTVVENTPNIYDIEPPIRIANATRNYDYHAFGDPLAPPYRRDEYQVPMVGIPTKGYPSTFKKMATLMCTDEHVAIDDPYKFLFLMGREKYPGANSYDYYAVEKNSDGGGVLKFDLPRKSGEFNTGDTIEIYDLKRKYRVKMDQLDGFRYDPYII